MSVSFSRSHTRALARRSLGRNAGRWLSIIVAATCLPLRAQSKSLVSGAFGNWHIAGQQTTRFEYYGVGGDAAASPYIVRGGQAFHEFNLSFDKANSEWDRWRGQLFGVLNDSQYRAGNSGLLVERFSLTRENGNGRIPYRVELGDYFGFFTYRTLQRSLKGVQYELQPASRGKQHSLQLVAGTEASAWRGLRLGRTFTIGASWLTETDSGNRWGLNLVHNRRDADSGAGALDRNQWVASLNGRRQWQSKARNLELEAELGHFIGDHNGVTTAASGQNRSDNAVYLQLSGRHRNASALNYRLLYEDYGQDYRPAGAIVPADRRSLEAHLGWRLPSNAVARVRLQTYRDNRETANPQDTDTVGFSLAGPLLFGLTGALEAYTEGVKTADRTTDRRTHVISLSASAPTQGVWRINGGLFWIDGNDRTATNADSSSIDMRLTASRALRSSGWNGRFEAGMTVRHLDSAGATADEVYPTIGIALERGATTLEYRLGLYDQNRHFAGASSVGTLTQSLAYRVRRGGNTFGIEIGLENRNPDPGADTDSLQLGVFWTRAFDGIIGPQPVAVDRQQAESQLASASGPIDLIELVPGVRMEYVDARLQAAGMTPSYQVGNRRLYETPVFIDATDLRQRLIVLTDGPRLRQSALLIDFPPAATARDIINYFERLRGDLTGRYGRPDVSWDRGDATLDLVRDLRRGDFVRASDWRLPGGVLRLGIPRRLDDVVRMEVHFASDLPSPRNARWGLESVR